MIVHPEVSAHCRRIGRGWRVFSSEKRSMLAKVLNARIWATRRLRYGVTGRKSGKQTGPQSKLRADAALAWSGNGNPDSKPDAKG